MDADLRAASRPAPAQRTPAALARAVPVPGWYVLVVQPLLVWLQRTGRVPTLVVVRRFGAWIELDLEDYVQRKIFCHSHQARELRFLARACRPGDVVVDVGANVGIFTLVAARATSPTGTVHAFEPVPATFETLRRNVRRNGLAGVHAKQLACSDGAGTISLGVAGPVVDTGGFSRHGRHHTVTVPAVRLDDELDGRSIRLLKLDVEGDEWRALDGLERTLTTSPPDVLLVEFSRTPSRRKAGAARASRSGCEAWVRALHDQRGRQAEGLLSAHAAGSE